MKKEYDKHSIDKLTTLVEGVDKKGIPASFTMLGDNVDAVEDMVKKMGLKKVKINLAKITTLTHIKIIKKIL